MPAGMLLKSPWMASSLADPDGLHTLDRFAAETGVRRLEPIPLAYFLDYCRWFRELTVPGVDTGRVCSLRRAEACGFRIQLADGQALEAARVVIAVGVNRFSAVSEFARSLPPHAAAHTADQRYFAG